MDSKYVIIYNSVDHVLSREKIDLQNSDAIGDKLDYIGDERNMYTTKNLGKYKNQKIVVYFNDRIDWGNKELYNPLGFMGEVFNNVIIVAAFDLLTHRAADIKMTTNDAFKEVKNFEACEFGWEKRG